MAPFEVTPQQVHGFIKFLTNVNREERAINQIKGQIIASKTAEILRLNTETDAFKVDEDYPTNTTNNITQHSYDTLMTKTVEMSKHVLKISKDVLNDAEYQERVDRGDKMPLMIIGQFGILSYSMTSSSSSSKATDRFYGAFGVKSSQNQSFQENASVNEDEQTKIEIIENLLEFAKDQAGKTKTQLDAITKKQFTEQGPQLRLLPAERELVRKHLLEQEASAGADGPAGVPAVHPLKKGRSNKRGGAAAPSTGGKRCRVVADVNTSAEGEAVDVDDEETSEAEGGANDATTGDVDSDEQDKEAEGFLSRRQAAGKKSHSRKVARAQIKADEDELFELVCMPSACKSHHLTAQDLVDVRVKDGLLSARCFRSLDRKSIDRISACLNIGRTFQDAVADIKTQVQELEE
ncbi:hypothetical protein B484DRAFT_467339 [Ochromonadaceae sp. CCMP2298]|nr:hypothetical protein B484DRAFT_467339 [Ochromonadaceae sp. CCMP2298]